MELIRAQMDNEWELNILDIGDSIRSNLVPHEFISTDGAYIQSLGNQARTVGFRAYFFGTSADTGEFKRASYNNHYGFLNAMSDGEEHILHHPKYGKIVGYINSLDIVHDDTQDYVTIDIEFLEQGIKTVKFAEPNTVLTIDGKNVHVLNYSLKKNAANIAAAGHSSILGKTIDASVTLSRQFQNVSQSTRQFLNELDSNIAKMDNFLYSITAPFNAVDAAVAYVGDIPSRIIGSINGALNRLTSSLAGVSDLPVSFTNNFIQATQSLYATITGDNVQFFQSSFKSVASGSILRQSGVLLGKDEDKHNQSLLTQSNMAFDIYGNRIQIVPFIPFLTINDLNNISYGVRSYVNETILDDRANTSLADMAASWTSYINDIKLRRMRVQFVTVNQIPIHVLMNQVGLPYNAADSIIALNGIRNPNFINGSVQVYAP